jgi:hypothetical protein
LYHAAILERASDAFATGEAVFRLIFRGRIDRGAPTIVKAREFLLKSQKLDG